MLAGGLLAGGLLGGGLPGLAEPPSSPSMLLMSASSSSSRLDPVLKLRKYCNLLIAFTTFS
jgi:hypothetical protein